METLDLQQLEWLLFALIGLILVVLVALIAYVVLANRRQRARMVQEYEAEKMVPRTTLQVTGPILTLVRDEEEGVFKVEVNKVSYRRLADIQDPQIRRQVVDAALELIRFTGVLGVDVAAPASIEATHRWREDLREGSQAELGRIRAVPSEQPIPATSDAPAASVGEATDSAVPAAPHELEEQFLSLLEKMGQAAAPTERPGVVSAIQRRMAAKQTGPEPSRTVVDDIEDIVQRRVRLIPALAGRDLHVRLDPGGSVRFAFEGREYENLEAVPNLTAQQLVRDAIREWEETT